MHASMSEQLEQHRPLPHQRLRKLAIEAVKTGDRSMKPLDADPEAALELFKVHEIELRWDKLLKEVEREIGAVGPGNNEGQLSLDRRSETDDRASQYRHGSQGLIDRPASHAEPRRASQRNGESPTRSDRPSRPAPSTKISRTGALAVATSSIFNLKIGSEMRYGGLTRFDCIQLKRKGIVVNHVADRLLTEVEWPDDRTPLEKCASEALAKDIHDSAYRVLDSLGVTNASA